MKKQYYNGLLWHPFDFRIDKKKFTKLLVRAR